MNDEVGLGGGAAPLSILAGASDEVLFIFNVKQKFYVIRFVC